MPAVAAVTSPVLAPACLHQMMCNHCRRHLPSVSFSGKQQKNVYGTRRCSECITKGLSRDDDE